MLTGLTAGSGLLGSSVAEIEGDQHDDALCDVLRIGTEVDGHVETREVDTVVH